LCQSGDSVAIDRPIGDQAERTRNYIGAHIPIWRAGTGFRMTASTGTKSGGLGGGGTRIKAYMLR
jgi:hypothetical protein